jgi:hypothetical protein
MAVIRLPDRPVRFCRESGSAGLLWLVAVPPFAEMLAASIGNHSGDLT